MGRRILAVGLLALVVTTTPGCKKKEGGGVITPVFEWLVAFATETGEWISEKAETLAEAISKAWAVIWGTNKVNGVTIDDDNPLRGTYDGKLKCAVEWLSQGAKEENNRLEIELDHPRMVRESKSSTVWELAAEERQRIEDLRDQLMKVD